MSNERVPSSIATMKRTEHTSKSTSESSSPNYKPMLNLKTRF